MNRNRQGPAARYLAGWLALAILSLWIVGTGFSAEPQLGAGGRVDVVLAAEHRKAEAAIKREFAEAGLENVHIQFVRLGRPPWNLGVGPKVSAERARAAIRLAKKYNGGVAVLLPERLFPDHYVTIASSNFDDTVEYPIDGEAMGQLQNPSLTAEQFHELYRRLTPTDQPPARKGRAF